MQGLLISVMITAILATVVIAWPRQSEERRLSAINAWAHATGWRVLSGSARATLPASWPDYPPAWGTPLITLDGERDGYPLALEWVSQSDSLGTVCYVSLRRDHPLSRFRRRLFARWLTPEERYDVSGSLTSAARAALDDVASARFWQLSGQHLVAVHQGWLEPDRIEGLIQKVTTVAASIDGSGPSTSNNSG